MTQTLFRDDAYRTETDATVTAAPGPSRPSVRPTSSRPPPEAFAGWRKSGNIPPLVFSRDEWTGASDAFPIEVTDILQKRHPIDGGDRAAPVSQGSPGL